MATPAVQTRFDYEVLAPETRSFVRERTERIRTLARLTVQAVFEIGKCLTEVKTELGHGRFADWIETEFEWTIRHAQTFMQVHERFKNENFSHLEIDVSALYLIAAPKTPEPVRNGVMSKAEAGQKITRQDVLRAIEQHKQLPAPEEARRIAIETGKDVLDSEGWYQPPVTVERQEAVAETLDLLELLTGLPESNLLKHSPRELLGQFATLRWPHNTRLRQLSLGTFIAWLTEFEDERKKGHK